MRNMLSLAVFMFASTAVSATKHYPTAQSFAHVASSSDRFEASSDGVRVSSPVAFRFTVPALRVRRVYCEAAVSGDGSKPPVVSLLQPDGTVLGTASSCRQGMPGAACEISLSCPAATDHPTTLVLLVEPGAAGATTVSAGVTAFDPHE